MSRLESNKIWIDANRLAEEIYCILDDFSQDEKLNTARRLQNSINDFIFYVGQAVGAEARLSTTELDWVYASKSLSGARTMYRFAGKQGMIELNPSIMVLMDKLESEIAKMLQKAEKALEEFNTQQEKQWLKRYELWRKMQENHEN